MADERSSQRLTYSKLLLVDECHNISIKYEKNNLQRIDLKK